MQLVFLGTPVYVLPVLEALLAAGHQVAAVATQPDKPAGRGRLPTPPPVKLFAMQRGLPILQPASLRAPEAVDQVAGLAPQALVVAAYGKLLPPALLGVPPRGVLNVHPSLLPRHRGPSPVATAILEEDEVAGVTIMLLDQGMDTGPILAQEVLGPILPQDTTETLTPRLFHLGAGLLVRTLERWERGELSPQPQDSAHATVTRRITKEDGALDFGLPARRLWAQVRAYQPWPGAYTSWSGRRVMLLETVPMAERPSGVAPAPGEVLLVPAGGPAPVAVGTGLGLLGIRRLQIEGRRSGAAQEFLQGHPGFAGARLPS
jgi:methionyl-tRNA formyltransferase